MKKHKTDKWQYIAVTFRNLYFDDLPDKLDEYGEEGWELTSCEYELNSDTHYCIFKRKIIENNG